MIENLVWQSTEQTQKVLQEIDKEISKVSKSALEFGGYIKDENLERKYSYTLGYLDSLKFIKKIIEENKDDEIPKAISRESRNRSY